MSEMDYQKVMSTLNWLMGLLEGLNQGGAVLRLQDAMLLLGRVQIKKD